MRDVLRYSWRSSQRDTQISTFSSSSTARQAIAPSKASASTEHQLPLRLPPCSPELDPVERWFEEFRRTLSNRAFESVALIQDALSETLRPYWETPPLLKRLTGYSWWVKAVEEIL
jgi:hypothetical protein